MRLDFLIEPAKFRHKGIFNVYRQSQTAHEEEIQETLPVWFSFKEGSGLMTTGEDLDVEFEEDSSARHTADHTLVFRFNKKLSEWFYKRNAIRLQYEGRQYPLRGLINYNGINVYHLAKVVLTLEQKFQ